VTGRAPDALDQARARAAREGPAQRAVVIGASAGGPAALRQLLPALDAALDAAVIVVLHVGTDGPDLLPALLDPHSPLPLVLARERCPLLPGVVHVAPSGYHLEVERDRRFSLSADARVCYSRPSIDVLFMSAAAAYGADLAGVVLSGASDDGAAGLQTIRDLGGLALVQTPTDAEIVTMPAAALARAGADFCAPLADLARRINAFARGR